MIKEGETNVWNICLQKQLVNTSLLIDWIDYSYQL